MQKPILTENCWTRDVITEKGGVIDETSYSYGIVAVKPWTATAEIKNKLFK